MINRLKVFLSLIYSTESTIPGAGRTQYHEGCSSSFKTFPLIGASGTFTYSVKVILTKLFFYFKRLTGSQFAGLEPDRFSYYFHIIFLNLMHSKFFQVFHRFHYCLGKRWMSKSYLFHVSDCGFGTYQNSSLSDKFGSLRTNDMHSQ